MHLSQPAGGTVGVVVGWTTGVSAATTEPMVKKNIPIEFNSCLFMMFALTKGNKSVIFTIIRIVKGARKIINHKKFKVLFFFAIIIDQS
ncbi:MAG: hypothetical protein JHD20_01525 [Gemmataceae bacterium]|nr:hypothetical protein [Gemmataceae bacterium]